MHYFGGKARIAKHIAAIVNAQEAVAYYEPFCGGLSVSQLIALRPAFLSDVHEPLINMYKALQGGWEPPTELSELDYHLLKAAKNPANPLTAFAGFGCSFAGRYFEGFARSKRGDDFPGAAARTLKRTIAALPAVTFSCLDYRELAPQPGSVIYCDPPYAGTKRYTGTPLWDAEAFWTTAASWSKTCRVLVSEYTAPEGWWPVWEMPTRLEIRNSHGERMHRVERLFSLQTCGGL